MKITIHRGAAQIGGSAVEVEHEGTRILLDLGQRLSEAGGENGTAAGAGGGRRRRGLDPADRALLERIPGLLPVSAGPGPAAVLLSHAHPDHHGLLPQIDRAIPVRMGPGAERVLAVSEIFLPETQALHAWRKAARIEHLRPRETFEIGPFRVTPYPVDHSVFDAYAFLIEAGGRRVFYTGDLRAHGRKPVSMWRGLLAALGRAGPIDLLLTEGTTLGRGEGDQPVEPQGTEMDLEADVGRLLRGTEGIALAQFSPFNIDRLVTFVRAAKKAGRRLVIDPYTAYFVHQIARPHAKAVRETWKVKMPTLGEGFYRIWLGYQNRKTPRRRRGEFERFGIGPDEMNAAPSRHLMLVRPGYLRDEDFDRLDLRGGRLLYSMWSGYREKPEQKGFEAALAARGADVVEAHVSGHIAPGDLRTLIDAARPRRVAPIHTKEPAKIRGLCPPDVEVLLPNDGVAIEVT